MRNLSILLASWREIIQRPTKISHRRPCNRSRSRSSAFNFADRLGHVGCGHSRFTDRVRERHEYAVRPGRIASKRIGDSRRTRSDTLETRQADVDRKSGGRSIRRSRGSSSGLLGRRLADPRHNALPSGFALPYWIRFTIDARVLAFIVGITLVATIVSGLVPAIVSAHSNAAEMMKEGGRGNSSRLVNIITRLLVIGQIALTAALLIATTLEIRSIRNQLKLDYGYDENAIYSARMALMEGAYTEDGRRDFFKRAVRELRANPQFDSAALTDRFRMTFDGGGQYEVDGQNYLTDRDRPRGNFESVSDNYFSTLGLKILEGRDFTIDDADAKQPVAIVNASFARKYWGNQSALGHQVRIFNPGEPQPWRTIVGVVPDTLMQGPFDQQTDNAGFYMPFLGASPAPQFCTILARPRAGQRAETSRSSADQSSGRARFEPADLFCRDTRSISQRNSVRQSHHRDAVHHLWNRRVHSVRGWTLRRHEFFSEPTHAGIWNPNGAWSGRSANFSNGHDSRRVAAHHRTCSRRRRNRLASGSRRSGGAEKHFVQSQRAGSDDLFRGGRNADVGCRRFLLCSCAPRHTCRPDSSITHRVI